MRRILQVLLPIGILVFFGVIISMILASKEEPQQRRYAAPSPQVIVRTLEREDFQITLHSQGAVRARTRSSLIPEVRGRIVSVSPNFQEGAFFEEGDVLLEIDDRDYLAELAVAKSALAQAELELQQETARYEQAGRDWERLNPGVDASELTLREPQIRQSRAAVASAEARIATAELNLERSKVRAPYAGRILTKDVDVGQYVTTGSQLAEIYAVDFAEVRLPLTATQIAYLKLPSIYRGANPSIENGPKVTLISAGGGEAYQWEGRIVRSEGAVDERTRQIFVVAQVENPYGESVPGRPPLKVGTFVQAEIEGTTLEDVFVVPRSVYRENNYVLVVDQESNLERREVATIWENDENIIVKAGLNDGDLLCLTDVPYALEGWKVVANNETSKNEDTMLASGSAPRPRSQAGPGGASYPDQILQKFGDKMPEELKDELMAVKASMDFSKLRPLMGKIASWAEANGEEMPPNPRAGQPRG
ncbi:efflux RND transporter periplasmic adaptor subunit [Pelagicoccus sp. SDUM812002]|uniref:efflux RND transporter periplasmic adaptor subunit n=1 Tax=Pelagicoccus sp. SDUM812002 TaxID=3041266 RepID=UPI0028100096|nr:efflux RND transporter periplasmic adaptor subunit [Pelagicoccus sp. SDUM812002]MDQ8185038.1 efflux RND transporter periplasmic adaptor subunit [Pelagicoccus sp. SDUM812002]